MPAPSTSAPPRALTTSPNKGGGGLAADNAAVADMLRETATLLEAQGDNVWRIAAYRKAADTIAALPRSVRDIVRREGMSGLEALPGIGAGIAGAIGEIVQTGRWSRLERLRGSAGVEAVFRTIPGIGPQLAQRLHDELEVDSLEALEVAAHDGRLERLSQVGARRAAAIRAALTQMLDRTRAIRRMGHAPDDVHRPTVAMLLDVDREYRAAAAAGTLPTLAPRRFNPEGKSWLPVLHTRRGDWHFTALYSNTARAHELGRVHDWVVVYAEDAQHHEHQFTIVTPPGGPFAGRRVVRGREDECRTLFADGATSSS